MSFNGTATTNFGGNVDNGVWIPEIYSQNVLLNLRRGSIADAITNSDYFGAIASYGDTVKIVAEPTITINNYTRGKVLTPQAIPATETTMVIDQAKEWSFVLDDIEQTMSHIGWKAMVTNQAAYQLQQDFDRAILTYMSDATNVLAANRVNDDVETNASDWSTADAVLNGISELSTRLSKQDVVQEGRYLVLNYDVAQTLALADSKLLNMDINGGAANLTSHPAYAGTLRGFAVYLTNNAPAYTSTGAGATGVDRAIVLAGQMAAVSTAQTMLKTEVLRDTTTFGDIIRGQHVYGRGVVRPEALAINHIKTA